MSGLSQKIWLNQMPNDDTGNALTNIVNQPIVKHSVRIAGHATSVSVEKPFWDLLKNLALANDKSINQLIAEIDEARSVNLSSAVRLYVLNAVRQPLQDPD